MAMGRRVVFMYLLAVWCCADTLVVRALLPSFQSHGAEPAVSSSDRVMSALQVDKPPNHHPSSPDCLKQPETSIRIAPMAVPDPVDSVIAEEPCTSPGTGPRMKDGEDERREECRKEELERGSSSGGGGHDSVVIDVRESEGAGNADEAEECSVCLENMRAGREPISSWDGCGHQFHTACIQNIKVCPLCRHPCSCIRPAPVSDNPHTLVIPDNPHTLVIPDNPHTLVLPDNPQAFVIPDNPHALVLPDEVPVHIFGPGLPEGLHTRYYYQSQSLIFRLGCGNPLCRLTGVAVWLGLCFTFFFVLFTKVVDKH